MRRVSLCFLLLFLSIPSPHINSAPASFMIFGEAAWYSSQSCRREGTSGVRTASGELFKEKALTCAMRSRDFGKFYRVTNLKNGKTVIVKHNDFGPARKWTDPKTGITHNLSRRVIDLSKAAFQKIADTRQGVIRVKVERVSRS